MDTRPRLCAEKHAGEGVYVWPTLIGNGDPDTKPDVAGLGYVFAAREFRKSDLRKRVITLRLAVNRTFDTNKGEALA
jgi:hypothetical protein